MTEKQNKIIGCFDVVESTIHERLTKSTADIVLGDCKMSIDTGKRLAAQLKAERDEAVRLLKLMRQALRGEPVDNSAIANDLGEFLNKISR